MTDRVVPVEPFATGARARGCRVLAPLLAALALSGGCGGGQGGSADEPGTDEGGDPRVEPDGEGSAAGLRFVVAEDGVLEGVLSDATRPGAPPTEAFALLSPPARGTLELGPGGRTFRYAPEPDFSGQDGFGYGAGDGPALRATIDVTPVPDAPVLLLDARPLVAERGEPFERTLVARDADGDALRFEASGLPAWLTLDPASGALAGTPTAADVGRVEGLSLAVVDPSGRRDERTGLAVEVVASSEAPSEAPTLDPARFPSALGGRERRVVEVFDEGVPLDGLTLTVESDPALVARVEGRRVILEASDVGTVTDVVLVVLLTDRLGETRRAVVPLRLLPTSPSGLGTTLLGHGGPGGRLFAPASARAPGDGVGVTVLAALDAIAPRSDIVLFDQRGTSARTQPPECRALLGTADRNVAALHDGLVDCVRAWERLPNNAVAAMRAEEYAGDVEMLRTALGIERWTLHASSYGARVALELLSGAPERVHAAVLDSPVPDGSSLGRTNLRAFAAALAGAISDCEDDARCDAAWPRFRDDVAGAPGALDADPVELEFPARAALPAGDAAPGAARFAQRRAYDGAFFLDQVRALLYSGTWSGSLPRLADAVARRDGSFLRRASGAQDPDSPLPAFRTVDPAQLLGQFERQVSLPVNVAYRCNERVRPPTGEPSPDGRARLERRLESLTLERHPVYADLAPVCAALGIDAAARAVPAPRAPIDGGVPVLVLAGGTDPLTSVDDARGVAALVEGARLEVLAGTGHSPGITSGCGRRVARGFLERIDSGPERIDAGPASPEPERPDCASAAARTAFAADATEAYVRTAVPGAGVTLRFPLGWGEIQPGVAYARYVSQDLFLAQGIGRATPERFMEMLLAPQPFETASNPDEPFGDGLTVGRPRWLGARTANGVDWTIHQIERGSGVINRFATATFGDRLGYVMLTKAPGVDFGSSIEDVLHAAIDGFEVD